MHEAKEVLGIKLPADKKCGRCHCYPGAPSRRRWRRCRTSTSYAGATPSSRAPTSAAASGSSSPATSTRCRSTTTCPSRNDGTHLHGLGTCDMKGGDAVILRLAATVPEPVRDVTYILYEAEEIESEFNGLSQLAPSDPDLMRADFAILMEPSDARGRGRLPGHDAGRGHDHGERAHSRPLLEGRQRDPPGRADPGAAHGVRAADAGHRRADLPRGPQRGRHQRRRRRQRAARPSAPSRSTTASRPTAARPRPRRSCATSSTGYDVRVTDSAPGALPGLDRPAAKEFVEAVGGTVNPKFGWTDVARFSRARRPAVNFGPGRPDAGPQAGGVRAARADPALRAGAARPGSGGDAR